MANRIAVIETSLGTIRFELLETDAPKTTENFRLLATRGYYDGVIFHRVIKNFMIQGGDPLGMGYGGESAWGGKFNDEIERNAEIYRTGYEAGVVAMANSGPNTNGSQFFIMHAKNGLPPAYSIFGRVVEGQDVVNKIANTSVNHNDKPITPVTMIKVTIEEAA
jgi:cyclophilin family peptidyl-prolyl cis-trans isomerase